MTTHADAAPARRAALERANEILDEALLVTDTEAPPAAAAT